MLADDSEYIYDIISNHKRALPQAQTAIGQEEHGETNGNDEEPNVPTIGLLVHAKLPHQSHGSSDNAGDEARGTEELTHGHAGAVGVHRREGAEDVGGAISKGKEGDTSKTLAETEDGRDGAQIDAEEVASGDADGRKEESQPRDEENEGEALNLARTAVVEPQVGDQTGILINAILLDKCALVDRMVDIGALQRLAPLGEERLLAAMVDVREERIGNQDREEEGRDVKRPGAQAASPRPRGGDGIGHGAAAPGVMPCHAVASSAR
jgi:hypothetical protein